MKASIKQTGKLGERFDEIAALLSTPEVQSDQNQFRSLGQEYAQIDPMVECYHKYSRYKSDLSAAKDMAKDSDPELRELAKEEMKASENALAELVQQAYKFCCCQKIQMTIAIYFWKFAPERAGTKPLFFPVIYHACIIAMRKGKAGQMKSINENRGEHGGYKEIILRINGHNVYSQLKFESGTHRVQRVPETESQGRVHTSACTVAIMPEVDSIDEIEINPADLRVDTFRASGAGDSTSTEPIRPSGSPIFLPA